MYVIYLMDFFILIYVQDQDCCTSTACHNSCV